MITNSKFQGTTPLVGAALLMGFGGQYAGSDLSYLLFSFNHNVEPKITLSPNSDQPKGVRHDCP
jgi:hypothetical protein